MPVGAHQGRRWGDWGEVPLASERAVFKWAWALAGCWCGVVSARWPGSMASRRQPNVTCEVLSGLPSGNVIIRVDDSVIQVANKSSGGKKPRFFEERRGWEAEVKSAAGGWPSPLRDATNLAAETPRSLEGGGERRERVASVGLEDGRMLKTREKTDEKGGPRGLLDS